MGAFESPCAEKPLGHRSYGSIPHLIGSNRGPGDKGVNEGMHRICTESSRKGDNVIVTEKVDGTNVSVAYINGSIVPLIRAGYRAVDSRYSMHHVFAEWVEKHKHFFVSILYDGERVCGEWLHQAHGIRYDLLGRSPFVAFDIMRGHERLTYQEFVEREIWLDSYSGTRTVVQPAPLLHCGSALPVDDALKMLGEHGRYGAIDRAEGVVYRIENNLKFDFMAKFVRSDFVPGKYLNSEILNRRF